MNFYVFSFILESASAKIKFYKTMVRLEDLPFSFIEEIKEMTTVDLIITSPQVHVASIRRARLEGVYVAEDISGCQLVQTWNPFAA